MIETTQDIPTRDGAMETFIVRPERAGPYPAVLMLVDPMYRRIYPRDEHQALKI